MKKTKIISSTIALFTLIMLHACREDEMDSVPENKILVKEKSYENIAAKQNNDSVKTSPQVIVDVKGNQIIDPPPKDRDQW